jgi:hypothetical protein
MRRHAISLCQVGLWWCLLPFAAPQAPDKAPPGKGTDYTLSVDVNLVLLHVSVFDEKDHLVKGLKKEGVQLRKW